MQAWNALACERVGLAVSWSGLVGLTKGINSREPGHLSSHPMGMTLGKLPTFSGSRFPSTSLRLLPLGGALGNLRDG